MCKFNVQRLTFNVFLFLILSELVGAGFSPVPVLADSPDTPPSVSDGRVLWTENCQPCHGPTGQGDGPAAQNIPDPLPDFSNPETARNYVPAENFKIIKEGRVEKLMPPWANRLSDAQIWDLTAYVWSLGVKPQELAVGEAIYAKECAVCHGANGGGDGPQAVTSATMPSFTNLPTIVQQSQAALLANYRKSGDPHASVSNLSEAELNQVLNYIRSFSFKLPQRDGVLKGQVINATTNEPEGNLEVTLRVFEGNTEVETKTTKADSAGSYTFDKLSTDHSTLYLVEGRYQDVIYASKPGVFTPNSTETTLDLNIYETTTKAETVGITQLHYLISFASDMVNVVQIFVLGNTGNQTYIGQKGQTLSFSLPQNAKNVTFQNDENGTRFVPTGSGYTDTAPIPPGEDSQSIVAVYGLPYEESLTIQIPLPANVASANVLMQDRGAQLTSGQLQFQEIRDFQGDPFSIFSGTNLKKGEDLILQLTNLDNLSFASPSTERAAVVSGNGVDQNLLRWVVVGLGGVVILLVAVGYPHFRPQLTHQLAGSLEDPSLRRQKLLVMLARLDELFETGELDKQIYHRARAKYKAELVKLMER